MNNPVTIEKISEVTEVKMLVEASKRDDFRGVELQLGVLPHTFSYGVRRTLKHSCSHCSQEVVVEFAYGKQILASGSLSRQRFHENRPLLDAVGNLFGQHLHHEIDVNGFEIYAYLTGSEEKTNALLEMAYYRCAHCRAQYLELHQLQLKDNRPPFEPDEIHIDKIYQVVLDHDNFMRTFHPVETQVAG